MQPRVFIASSKEGLRIAKAIRGQIASGAEVDLWSDRGVFPIGAVTLTVLEALTQKYDFAIIVMTPDDVTRSRSRQSDSPRDNVLFELGLFMGRLGGQRAFIVRSDDPKMKFPSDLAGLVVGYYERSLVDRDCKRAVTNVCNGIRERFVRLGLAEFSHATMLGRAVESMSALVERTQGMLKEHELAQDRPAWFESLTAAEPELLQTMFECTDRGEEIELDWLGMTMFNVWNTLPGLLAKLERRNPRAVRLRVAMLSKEWLERYRVNKSWTADSAEHQYRAIVDAFDDRKRRGLSNWRVEVRRYSHMPAVHGGLVNDRSLLVGTCQWDAHGNLWAGDRPYELFRRDDRNRGNERIGVFKGWFDTCWRSGSDPSVFAWKT